eukprot:gnl/TRDRNA2_/TRDRNA2_177743_c3_seq2.p2 gnl/TRDRNA2_/TRDRNA2_177743_c3~~gnl/TRDRNA2_/TRDRNA2_177743_c3_seq2.p2  ORF type:complete len:310 (+),score=45.99 gnl/TRDRNA2_/TRDRNA2_177743_c3_seq2:1050-1979(+)
MPAPAVKRAKADKEWTRWTWNEYHQEVLAVARALMACGFSKHQATSILGFNSPEWYFASFGTVFAGGTPAGIYITNAPEACEYIMSHSKSNALFVDSDMQLQKVLQVKQRCTNLTHIIHWGNDCPADGSVAGVESWRHFVQRATSIPLANLEARIASMSPDEACYLSYTSGTTGNPKAVMYSHDSIVFGFAFMLDYCWRTEGMGFGEREVSYMPLSHIAGNAQLLGAICQPNHVNSEINFVFPDAMQGSLHGTILDARPTVLLAVPRVWEKLLLAPQGVFKEKPQLQSDPKAALGHRCCTDRKEHSGLL